MQRVSLAEDLQLSRMVYGMWRLADGKDTSPGEIIAKLETCLEHGITTIDQADVYGGYTTEALLGSALKSDRTLRDRIEIVTKCGIVAPVGRHADVRIKHYDTSRNHIETSVEASLVAMGTDRIDVLLIHRPDPFMDHEETGATLDGLVSSGKVRRVGVSNFRPHDWTLLQSAMSSPLVTNQIEMSLLNHQPLTDGSIAFLQERRISPMAWSPLAGGYLMSSGNTLLNDCLRQMSERLGIEEGPLALAWLMAHPSAILPVIGTNNRDRIAQLAKATEITLGREDWFELYTAALGHEVA